MTEKTYRLYKPFYAAIGGGGVSIIEKVEVNEDDLEELTRQLRTMSTQRVLAFFGQLQPVLASVSKIIEENVDIASLITRDDMADAKTTHNCIHVVLKDDWVAIFAVIDQQFFENRVVEKESIVVTLFRYLEDLSPLIVLCVDDHTIASFSLNEKNPFSIVAHSARVYKLETPTHVRLQASCLETNCRLLEDDQEFSNCKLLLNDNGSRFFLRLKLDFLLQEELEIKNSKCREVVKSLIENYNFNEEKVESLICKHGLHLSSEHLRSVISAYSQYTKGVKKSVEKLTSFLNSGVYAKTWEKIQGESHLKFLYGMLDKIIKQSKRKSSDIKNQMKSSAEDVAKDTIGKWLSNFETTDTNDGYDATYQTCLNKILQFFTGSTGIAGTSKENELMCVIKEMFPEDKFRKHIESTKEVVEKAFSNLSSQLTASILSLQRHSATRLNVYAINTQQQADGTCSGLIIAPYLSQITVQPEELLQYFPTVKRDSSSSIEEMMRNFTIKAFFPMKAGRSFLLLFEHDKHQALVAISSVGSHSKLTEWQLKNSYLILPFAFLPSESPGVRFVLITAEEGPAFKEFEVNESLKYKVLRFAQIEGKINGLFVSAAAFPNKRKMLLLTNKGCLYEIDLNDCSSQINPEVHVKELKVRKNEGNQVISKSPSSQNESQYSQIKTIYHEDFFILLNDSEVDVYDWNLARQLSLNIPGGSDVKLFSDNKNVYLVAVKHRKIVSYVFADLGAHVTIKHQEEAPAEKLDGYPIIDVIYASYLKYGPNSLFIGAPAQNHYVIALQNKDDYFDQKLLLYLKTFRKTINVTSKTLLSISQECEPQIANSHLPAIMSSRTPVQICTVEANNLLPLVDGNRMRVAADRATSIAEAAECMSFAHLERVVKEFCDDRSVRVVSIIGRQSSGKSYLLNQLFGTRFSVAAARCTDGIWMSYARIVTNDGSQASDSQSFLVLDCEGLFSINRNEQEEVKLLMVLAAISDVTILNQDLNFNRYINKLFANLNNAVGKVSGSNYFHGELMVAVRDVGSNESVKAAEEFERNIKTINERSEYQFLLRLFQGTLILQCLNHFESDIFVEELEKIRKILCGNRVLAAAHRTINGRYKLKSIKIVLLQVYNDDEQSADEHVKQIDQIRIANLVTAAWGEIGMVGEKADETFRVSVFTDQPVSAAGDDASEPFIELAQSNITFDHTADKIETSFEKFEQYLEERFFESIADRHSKQGYNQRWTAFNAFLEEFVRQRAQLLEEYAQEQVLKLGRTFDEEDKQNLLISLQEKIRSFTIYHGLCLENCALCYLKCLQRKGHKAALEPQKQQIQNQLKSVKQALSLEKPIEKEDMLQSLSKTHEKLRRMQEALQQVEEDLMVIEERYQKSVQLDQALQILNHKDSEISGKLVILKRLNLLICDCCRPTDTLQNFLISFIENLKLTQTKLENIRSAIQRSETQHIPSSPVTSINLPNLPINELAEDSERVASELLEADRSIAALSDAMERVMATVSSTPSIESQDEAMDLLAKVCADFPILIEHASNITVRAEKTKRVVSQQVKLHHEFVGKIKIFEQEIVHYEQETEFTKNKQKVLFEESLKLRHAVAENEAKQLEIQRDLEAKLADLEHSQFQLSTWTRNFTSLPILEQNCNDTTEQLDCLLRKLEAVKSEHSLLLSSSEEFEQVTGMMLEYFTLFNTEKRPIDHDDPEREVIPEEDEERGETLKMLDKYANERIKPHDSAELIFLAMHKQYSELEREEESIKCRLTNLENEYISLKEEESTLQGKQSVLKAVQAEEKRIQGEKTQVENLLADCERQKNAICTSEFYRQRKRRMELQNLLSEQYPQHFNDEELRRNLLTTLELKHSAENLKFKLETARRNETNVSDVEASEKAAENPHANIGALIANIESKQIELSKTKHAIESMLWNHAVRQEVSEMETQLSVLKKRLAEYELVLPEWRDFTERTEKLISEYVRQLCMYVILKLLLHEQRSSLNETETKCCDEEKELKQKQDKIDSFRSDLKIMQENEITLALWVKIADEKATKQMVYGTESEQILGRLKSEIDLRKNINAAKQLELDLASLEETRLSVMQTKNELEQCELESVAELKTSLASKRSLEESLRVEVKNLLVTQSNQRAYIKLLDDQEKLEKNISCVCSTTDHECDQQCSICPDNAQQKCKHKAGHDDPELLKRGLAGPTEHCCNKPKHDCEGTCYLCENQCVYPLGHSNPAHHLCSSTHQCKSRCQYCTNRCQGNLAQQHSTHVCNEDKCPKRCILCGNACSGKHDHDETTTLVDVDLCFSEDLPASLKDIAVNDPENGKLKLKMHLCSNEHLCRNLCDKGVCEIYYVPEIRKWTQLDSSMDYEYIKPERKTRRCAIRLPPGSAWHTGKHDCSKQHTCTNTCPECGGFCKENINHEGSHKTAVHRNMEHCYCVTRNEAGTIQVQDEGDGKKARVYQAGDPLTPEICTQHCNRKGRAHYHLKTCPGGSNCGQIKYPIGVKHCNEQFYPHVDKVYDKYLCLQFWESVNWEPPSNNDSIQKCNFVCPHSEHSNEPDKLKFCVFGAWHSQSHLAKDHIFECRHDFSKLVFNGLDMCFCIDTTGSMSRYIHESAASIKKIMSDVIPQLALYGKDTSCLRFAVVGYKDHNPPNDNSPSNVVDSKDFCSDSAAIEFLDGLKACGGGDQAEAVLDGLLSVTKLSWRPDCEKLLIHICDAPPHGKQFATTVDSYPDGCPCKLNEADVLKKLKSNSIKYHVIPLNSSLNNMIEIFSKHITVVTKELSDTVELSSLIPDLVCRAIEDSELTATFSEL